MAAPADNSPDEVPRGHTEKGAPETDAQSSSVRPEDASRSFFGLHTTESEQGASFQGTTALQPGSSIGPFVLRRFIARGGMGQVWEAEDRELRRTVALKLVLPERVDERTLKLFSREARAGGRIAHKNIVTTLAFGSDAGQSWIAQELVEGSWSLRDLLEDLRTAGETPKGYYRQVAKFIAQVADGLQAAHDAGVIHRDIKPPNILITPDDTPKITDFGLARVTDDSWISQSGEIGGTWSYMSPEQVTAKRMGMDHRTDIFSLGVVFYEMLALCRPFEGDTTHQIAEKIITHDPPNPAKVRSQCPRELALICSKTLEKAPGSRYQTSAELAADLRRHLSNEPIVARPPFVFQRLLKWGKRNPTKTATGITLIVAVIATSYLQASLTGPRREPDLVDAQNELGSVEGGDSEAQIARLQLQIDSLIAQKEILKNSRSEIGVEETSSEEKLLNKKIRVLIDEIDNQTVLGPAACAECHGDEQSVWGRSAHFETLNVLGRDKAYDIADEMGLDIDDEGEDAAYCQRCHATFITGPGETIGVSCESCHGPAWEWMSIHSETKKEGGKPLRINGKSVLVDRDVRIGKATEMGMIDTGSVYAQVSNCLSCHTVPDEALVNYGGHSAGTSDFEMLSYSQGEVRHHFLNGAKNQAASADRQSLLFVVGKLADLEVSLRNLSRAREGEFANAMMKRIHKIMPALKMMVSKTNFEKPMFEALLKTLEELELAPGVGSEACNAAGALARKVSRDCRGFQGLDLPTSFLGDVYSR
jgi:serine/threonine protein kinase